LGSNIVFGHAVPHRLKPFPAGVLDYDLAFFSSSEWQDSFKNKTLTTMARVNDVMQDH
jgi:heat shock protein HspQ